ncbi:dehydrogenase E1 component subunit alpha/beta [candidate division KSB1 bacterium]|nr:dehydrogenase E1 component subunit alpha/beta [candidate division KSB1 bacterium]
MGPIPEMKILKSKNSLLQIYRRMLTSRYLDEKMLVLLKQGKSFFHIGCAGHEAAQIGAAMAFKPGSDWFYPYYRDQAFVLQLGVTPKEIFLEFLARKDGPSSGGRQMPQHYGHAELHIMSQSSSTGTQYLQAAGTAIGCKKNADGSVVYVSSGEGAASQGDFYEAINWATRDQLPIVFFIQDNKYAISVPREQQTAGVSVYEMVMGYQKLHRHQVDGLDVGATFKILKHCVDLARAGNGPSLVVAHTLRLLSHSSSDDQRKYRDEKELASEREKDPILLMEKQLAEKYSVPSGELEAIRAKIRKEVDHAAESAESEPMPEPSSLKNFLIAPLPDFPDVDPPKNGKKIVMVDAINHALREEMERDEKILVYGEDVADAKGGVFTVTKGLSTTFGTSRVFNSPLAESSIIGTAIGLAISGYKPVVEIQFGDYIWTAMMQIRNELATIHWRSNGSWRCPVVIRVAVGGYIHGGLCHSQNIESFFAHVPGLLISYPSNAADAKGLLKYAIRCENPVLFLEHKGLYRQSFAMSPEPENSYVLPFGKAAIKITGADLTIVTWGATLEKSLQVAAGWQKQGRGVEVIDIRTIVPLDMETITTSVQKTGRVLVVHEDTLTGGFGAEIASRIADRCFEYLDAPIKRVAAQDVHVPFNWELEKAMLPQTETIQKAVLDLLDY